MCTSSFQAPVLWFTGLSGAGKSTLAASVAAELASCDISNQLLDADQVRKNLCPDLGFSEVDRTENVRRLAYVAGMLATCGITTLIAAVSPRRHMRALARESLGNFIEVFVDAPLAVCEQRDPLGLYRRFRRGEIQNLSGLDSPYEPPLAPEVHCQTEFETIEESTTKVMSIFARHATRTSSLRASKRVPC